MSFVAAQPAGWVLLGVLLGSALGAQLRYAVERLHARWSARQSGARRARALPWSTLVVNVLGSAVLGGVAAAGAQGSLDATWTAVLGGGLAGGLSTFSTFAFDVVELVREGRPRAALATTLLNVVLALAAAALAYLLVAG